MSMSCCPTCGQDFAAIAAVRWNVEAGDGVAFAIEELPKWFADAYGKRQIDRADDKLIIVTLEGVMTADPNDWIIQGVKGEIYPCKPEIFAATYEPVS